MSEIEDRIAALGLLSAADLREQYAALLGKPAPARIRAPLLRLAIAHALQLEALGTKERRQLEAGLARAAGGKRRRAPTSRPAARAGSRLVRDWNGRTHLVEVLERGYRYESETYASLSAIATHITGVKRNGPAFFGLRAGRSP